MTSRPPIWSRAVIAGAAMLCAGALLAGCTSTSPTPNATSSAQITLEKSINNLIKTGIAQAEAGKTSNAVTTFNNVLTLDPGNKYAYFNLGVIAENKQDSKGALAFYNKALKTDPKFTSAMFNKAVILEATDLDQAIAIYQQIVAINPQASTAFLRLSFAYDKQGKTDQAKAARAKAIALDPGLANVTPTPAP